MELIDIKLDQVNEWLLLRKKIDKNWPKALKTIEFKQSAALTKLQENKQFLHLIPENYLGYLQATQVLSNLLESSETDKTKSVFGNYNFECLYDWDSIVKLYEKNNLNLADCGKQLLQLGVYEIPSLKSTLQSYEKQIKELQHKDQSLSEEILKKNKAFKEKCKSYSIEGINLAYELKSTTRKIPEIYIEIVESLKSASFSDLLNCYQTVTHQNHNCSIDLPTIARLRNFVVEIDLEKVKNKYCNVMAEETLEVLDDKQSEWVIEMIEEGRIVEIVLDDDLPLSNRQLRTDLITELTELQSFSEVYGEHKLSAKKVLDLISSVHELVLIHEQPGYLDRLIQQFNRLTNHNLQNKLTEAQKLQETLKDTIKNTHTRIYDLLKFASKLITALEIGINKLFPNISVKIVGEIVKDIKTYLVNN
jgi:CDK5 regulatory subunit-associated protein 3